MEKIPRIGFGTWQLQGDQCVRSVRHALDVGYSHIDTAEIYGNEEDIGKAISGSKRDDLWITSKVWWGNLNHNDILTACYETLRKLKTDYLDLYLIHWPNSNINYDSAFKAMKKLKESGRIRNFGVSNFTIEHLKEVIPIARKNGLDIYCNQVEFHPLLYQKDLLDFCKENGIILVAYSPLGHGKTLNNEIVRSIAEKNGVTPAQVCLRWALEKGVVIIPKSRDKERIEENLSLDFDLSKEDIASIDNLSEQTRFIHPQIAEFDKEESTI